MRESPTLQVSQETAASHSVLYGCFGNTAVDSKLAIWRVKESSGACYNSEDCTGHQLAIMQE